MAMRSSVPTETLSADTRQLFDVLNEEGDLAVILIATSFIDACLVSLLEKKFLKGRTTDRLLSPSGTLGSFRARADLCYSLGLIPKRWHGDLTIMMEIRNTVAHHHLSLSFSDPKIIDKCAALSTYLSGDLANSTGRTRFVLCVVMLANWLILNALQLEKQGPAKAAKEPGIVYARVDGSGKN